MRHAIVVVGSEAQRAEPMPVLALRDDEPVRMTSWFACRNQEKSSRLLEERGPFARWLLVPLLAYQFYILVQNTKLWAGKRPLVMVRGRGLASRLAAYAGNWGGGDVVKADQEDLPPLGPTRFLLDEAGSLKLRED